MLNDLSNLSEQEKNNIAKTWKELDNFLQNPDKFKKNKDEEKVLNKKENIVNQKAIDFKNKTDKLSKNSDINEVIKVLAKDFLTGLQCIIKIRNLKNLDDIGEYDMYVLLLGMLTIMEEIGFVKIQK